MIGTAGVMTAVLILLFALPGPDAQAITNDLIKQKQQELDAANDQKKQIQSQITNLRNLKKDLEAKKQDLQAYVMELDSALNDILANIDDLTEQINELEKQIETTEAELAEAEAIEEDQYNSMMGRMRRMYEQGDSQSIQMLIESKSIREMLTRADYIERIVAYDKMMWEQYKATREYVELCRDQLRAEKDVVDEAKAAVEAERDNMEALIAQKEADINEYNKSIANDEAAIAEYEQEMKEREEEIQAIEAAILEEKRRIIAQNGSLTTYDGGAFCKPIASYKRVSSEFGYRPHPIFGTTRLHNGIDLAAPTGTAIYAAYDGRVVAATYSYSMGNYIMIDHGDNLYTIYMHCSALYSSVGDVVVRGETIAAVGSTGNSTGPHLHFTVRRNGTYENPRDYVSF